MDMADVSTKHSRVMTGPILPQYLLPCFGSYSKARHSRKLCRQHGLCGSLQTKHFPVVVGRCIRVGLAAV